MSYSLSDQVMALAGIFQACVLVDGIASDGKIIEERAYQCSISSLFYLDSDHVAQVYGGGHTGLQVGLNAVVELFSNTTPKEQAKKPPLHYMVMLLFLENQLRKRNDLLIAIRQRIGQMEHQRQHFSDTHHSVIANLAELYQDSLSTFKQRIHVKGQAEHLRIDSNMHKIRALLLAGIRSTMLWRQTGGKRWHLLLHRKKFIQAARQLASR